MKREHNTQHIYSTLLKAIGLFGAFLLCVPSLALAAPPEDRLTVDFTPDPLFIVDGFLPGDSHSGTVTVTNTSGEEQVILAESINVIDEGLADALFLTITDGQPVEVFNASDGTFGDFLRGGEWQIGTLPDGASETYAFTVDFPTPSGNETQTLSLGFDLCIGFQGDSLTGVACGDTVISDEQDTNGDDTGSDPGTTIEGGGGISTGENLAISNEGVESFDINAGTATITWDTNMYATGQVVYGPMRGWPYSLDILALNFGYPQATGEVSLKTITHSITLTGLTPDEEYAFRVVSRASPPTVSYEHRFTFAAEAITTDATSDTSGGETDGSGSTAPDDSVTPTSPTTPSGSSLLGGSGGAPSDSESVWSSFLSQLMGTEGSTADGLTPEDGTSSDAQQEDLLATPAETSQPTETDNAPTEGAQASDSSEEGLSGLAAATAGFFSPSMQCLSVFLIFVFLSVAFEQVMNRQRQIAHMAQRLIFWESGMFTSIIVSALAGWKCALLPLLVTLIALVAWHVTLVNKQEPVRVSSRPNH